LPRISGGKSGIAARFGDEYRMVLQISAAISGSSVKSMNSWARLRAGGRGRDHQLRSATH
jgi:hypothetical protein